MKKLHLEEGNALVIVAHPDDETIWMGGTILSNPNIHWTIFSLCRSDDPDRAPKFKRICKEAYNAKAIITNFEDEGIMKLSESIPKIEQLLSRVLPQKHFPLLFTHGANGEYGHPRHIGLHRAVKHLVRSGLISAEHCFLFSYKKGEQGRMENIFTCNTLTHSLSPKELRLKKRIIKEWYGFHSRWFVHVSCLKAETFTHNYVYNI